ncbi:type II secretion system F family protein [Kocuria marina]|uniref:type II secretion system F family protein n=1 Tax=Kocuria marina TaxID=223184 RepID=UPI0022E65E22|nr:type II secretion system F family protein [Kocuria marina]
MMAAVLVFVLTAAALLVWSGGGTRGGRLAVLTRRTGSDDDGEGGAARSRQPGVFARWRRRDRAAEAMQWVIVVRRLAALLQAGRAPARVFGELPAVSTGSGPTGRWIARMCGDVHAAAQVGIPVSVSLTRFASAPVPVGDRELAAIARSVCAQLAACWEISERSGASLGRTLSGVAESLESQLDAQAARDSALAGPRVTVWTLSWLPMLALGLGVLMGTDPISTLLTTWWGRVALTAGAALSIAGRLWTRTLMHRAEAETAS